MKAITDYKVGDEYEQSVKITEDMHHGFVRLSGDDSLIHTDIKFCKANGYDRLVGHAFLITALLSQIYGKKFPGGNELCVSQTSEFRKPFFVDDTLLFQVKVTGTNNSLELLNTRVTVFNQDSAKIYTGDGILKLCLRN